MVQEGLSPRFRAAGTLQTVLRQSESGQRCQLEGGEEGGLQCGMGLLGAGGRKCFLVGGEVWG